MRFKKFIMEWKKLILILKGLLTIVVPGIIVAFAKTSGQFRSQTIEQAHIELKSYLETFWGFMIVICLPVVVGYIIEVFIVFAEESVKKLQSSLVMYKRIVEHLNSIVAEKTKYFEQYQYSNEKDTFTSITQPEIRIKIILDNLCAFLKGSLERNIKVVLFKIDGGYVSEIMEYVPADSVPTIEQSQFKQLFASNVARKGMKLFVSDIETEGAKNPRKRIYIPSSPEDTGSIIGYPIKIKGNVVRYVITIKSDKNVISKKFDESYSPIIGYFIQRIKLEASLRDIKLCEMREEHA